MPPDDPIASDSPDLEIALDRVCYIILRAREFDVKDAPTDFDSGSNAADDNMADVLEDHPDDPVESELTAFIDSLNDDEQIEIVALMWLGRSDATAADFPELREEAARAHNENTAGYLLGTPLLGDHLENGLATLGLSCSDIY